MHKMTAFFVILVFFFIPSGMYFYKVSIRNTPSLLEKTSSSNQLPNQPILEPTSGADLSYIMVVAEENVELKLIDSYGNIVGELFVQNPLKDPISGKLSGAPVKELLSPDPASGQYKLLTSSRRNYLVEIYLYDRNAEVNIERFKTAGDNSYLINFDKENSKNSTVSQL